jgi:hypothetical protein
MSDNLSMCVHRKLVAIEKWNGYLNNVKDASSSSTTGYLHPSQSRLRSTIASPGDCKTRSACDIDPILDAAPVRDVRDTASACEAVSICESVSDRETRSFHDMPSRSGITELASEITDASEERSDDVGLLFQNSRSCDRRRRSTMRLRAAMGCAVRDALVVVVPSRQARRKASEK